MILYKKLHSDVALPIRSDPGAIGLDIAAYLITPNGRSVNFILPPSVSRLVPTGLILLPPKDCFLAVCSRSGLASDAIFVTNAPGIIDPNYTGELKILLYNGGHTSAYLKHGDRIAQIVCLPAIIDGLVEMFDLPKTTRGDKGFGSPGRPHLGA